MRRNLQMHHSWISEKLLPMWIYIYIYIHIYVIFYFLNSHDIHPCNCIEEDQLLTIRPRTFCLHKRVPQGSILGHLLFLIYFNNIVNSCNILSFVLFAYGTAVYVQHYSIDGAIQILNTIFAKVNYLFISQHL